MMRSICIFLTLTLIGNGICIAQDARLPIAPARININGQADEWSADKLINDQKLKCDYLISADNDNIYLILKTNNQVKQTCITGAGITFSINTQGKKTKAHTLTFPTIEKFKAGTYMDLSHEELMVQAMRAKNRKITITGFKDISDDELSPLNPYGIKTAIGFDDQGYLIYEAAVPRSLLKSDNDTDKEWWFNIRINGLQRFTGKIIVGNEEKYQSAFGSFKSVSATPGASAPIAGVDDQIPDAEVWVKYVVR